MIKERPILFSAPMVRAILEGRKAQTRRIVKKQISDIHKFQGWIIESTDKKRDGCASWGIGDGSLAHDLVVAKCTYGKPGDRLWVRETFAQMDTEHCACYESCGNCVVGKYAYKADGNFDEIIDKWKPSIHMPRSASRILLEITNVRVERLNDISEEDAIAEGSHAINFGYGDCYALGFKQIWESINGVGSWDINPWVWILEFKTIETK